MTKQAYWNGLETTARVGTAIVADTPDTPLHWAKTEGIVGERIGVIEVKLDGVNYGGGIIYLDDRIGDGSAVVFERARRSERYVTIVPDSFLTEDEAVIRADTAMLIVEMLACAEIADKLTATDTRTRIAKALRDGAHFIMGTLK